ncbi:MAG: nucleotidyltransferase family protein [Thermoplasmata archaeon]
MYQKWNRYRILTAFFDEANRKWQLRQLERKVGIGLPSVKNHDEALLKEGLLRVDEEGSYRGYRESMGEMYRTYKSSDLLTRLRSSGLVRELEERCAPNRIVLYGSGADGRDDERGDIDIFVESKERRIDLERYEGELHRTISLLFEPDARKLNPELRNTIANGIVLSGFLRVILWIGQNA